MSWYGQFTASQPFHSLTISIMNGFARLRSEFTMYNLRHTPTFKSWVVMISAQVLPYISHQDRMFSVWFKQLTPASQPFQNIIISIRNDWRRLRLVYVLYNGHLNVFFSHVWSQSCFHCIIHFSHQDWVSWMSWYWQFTASQPFHSLTISIMNVFARLRSESDLKIGLTLI